MLDMISEVIVLFGYSGLFTSLPLVLSLIMKVIGNGYHVGDHTDDILVTLN
jgi:hypothetical protein